MARRGRGMQLLLALLLAGPWWAVLGIAPASACACGAFASPADQRVDTVVTQETAVLSHRDGVETMIMSLDVAFDAAGTTIIMPTPSVPTVTAGSADTLDEMAVATAPREKVEHTIWGSLLAGSGSGGDAAAPGATQGVTVHQQGRIGDVEVAVLDGSVDGVTAWLGENGFALPDTVAAELPAYVADGWTFTAVRLADGVEITGRMDPLRLDFPSETLVYPMRMSHAAGNDQMIHLFLIGDEAYRRTDAAASSQTTERPWVADPYEQGHTWSDPVLREMTGYDPTATYDPEEGPAMVTEFVVTAAPETITTDFVFEPDPGAAELVPTYTVTEVITVAGIPVGYLLVLGGVVVSALLVAAAAAFVIVRLTRPRARS